MEAIGAIIATLGSIALAIGYFMSIYSGFRKNVLWGLGMLFLPPIVQIIFIVKHPFEARKWGRFFSLGLVTLIIGGMAVTYPIIGLVLIIGVAGAIIYRVRLGNKSIPGFSWLAGLGASNVSYEEVEFNPSRYAEFIKQNIELLQRWPGSANARIAQKAFLTPELLHDIKQFNTKHLAGMLAESADRLNWADERFQLFLNVMQRKYKLKARPTIALLLYVNEEINYKNYFDNFSQHTSSGYSELIKEVVLYDIYAEREPNFDHIHRLVNDLRLHKNRFRSLEKDYKAVREELKVSRFAKSLDEQDSSPYKGIEHQIKSDIQLAAIDSRISQLLNISPQSYHVVGRDYSRDSRIDNFYKQHFSYALSRAFDGHCCKCGEGMGQLEFDHFWLPKSSGGNFLMRSDSGLYVNNCIPLCRSCNSSKGHRDFREFFAEKEIEDIVKRSQSIEPHINQRMASFDDPDFPNRAY
jgi:5-methylcytosine-specific restriction endonuclease McrA